MAWKMNRTAAGYSSLEDFDLDAEDVPAVLQQLTDFFQARLSFSGRGGIGLSVAAADIYIDAIPLTVGGDNWSGVFIMAWSGEGDKLVQEIEGCLNSQKTDSENE